MQGEVGHTEADVLLQRRHLKTTLRPAIRFDAPARIATASVTHHVARQKPQVIQELLRPTRIAEQERKEHHVCNTIFTKRRLRI
jgi:hypothetical protein